jgi:hypothetical protein
LVKKNKLFYLLYWALPYGPYFSTHSIRVLSKYGNVLDIEFTVQQFLTRLVSNYVSVWFDVGKL